MKSLNQIYNEVKQEVGNPSFQDWLIFEKDNYTNKHGKHAEENKEHFVSYLNKRYNAIKHLNADGQTAWQKISSGITNVASTITDISSKYNEQTQESEQEPVPDDNTPEKKPFFKRPAGIVVIGLGLISLVVIGIRIKKINS
jgi:hypothetical protein